MGSKDKRLPLRIGKQFRTEVLNQLRKSDGVESNELSLFEWYVKETEVQHAGMLAAEQQYIKEQIDSGSEDINDGGMLPVQFFIKRSRYSHVIYLVSLMETFTDHACLRLRSALPDRITFSLEELSGGEGRRERLFLQRYGNFAIGDNIWVPFKVIYLIRNALVHDNGVISNYSIDKQKKFRQKLKDIPGLNVKGSEIEIEPDFVSFSISALRAFMDCVNAGVVDAIGLRIRLRSST